MKTAKLFQNGQSQAVRLPREFRFAGQEVYVKRTGNAVMLIPVQDSWRALLDSLELFSSDFLEDRSQPEASESRENVF